MDEYDIEVIVKCELYELRESLKRGNRTKKKKGETQREVERGEEGLREGDEVTK